MQPHVFVVMPIGVKEVQTTTPATDGAAKKPAIKISFNEVYKLLVEPALTKAGCVAVRADEEPREGEVHTDMYFELVTAEFVLADISILDADIFYQLGVRHGVAQRGALMLHGGWTKRPFDVAPDQTFDYDGRLFVSQKEERDQLWQERLDAEILRLAEVLKSATDLEEETRGSPVYKEMPHLVPVDWKGIRAKQSKYFGEVFADWKLHSGEASRNSLPGDILTFADDAPTRFHRAELLWAAADLLCDMRRFNAAFTVLRDLFILASNFSHMQARMNRTINRTNEGDEDMSWRPDMVNRARFRKVLVASGHMIDKPDRPKERFPARKEAVVRERLARQLESWDVGASDLAICGGARGGDILFAELCAERGAEVWLMLALPEKEFLKESVRLPESDWEQRYYDLRKREGVKVYLQSERLKQPPAGASVYSRNNLWMINTARVEADDPKNLYAVLVWDEQPTGDGAGGTSDFAARIKDLGGQLAPVINPTKL